MIQPQLYFMEVLLEQRTRTRRIPDWQFQGGCSFRSYTFGVKDGYELPPGSGPEWNSTYTPHGLQTTVDENHGFNDYSSHSLRGVDGDIGGNFSMTKSWVQLDQPVSHHIDQTGFVFGTLRRQIYDGPVVPTTAAFSLSNVSYSPTSLGPMGTTAISRCKPTNNVADLGASLTEIFRDGLPKLLGVTTWEERAHVARSAGGEYLNSEFGWVPLLGDVHSACYGLANAHRLMSNYEKNAGKLVRRRYEFPIEYSEVTVPMDQRDVSWYSGAFQDPSIDSSKPPPFLFKTTKTYKRTWFSGAFTYYLPTGYLSRTWIGEKAKQAGYLLGIEVTPNVLWNAAPWSWAIDWFSNAGDVINNLSDWATDGLVMKHGYVMEHRFKSVTYFNIGPSRFKPYGSVYSSPVTACFETKRREKASPFGFGLSWNGMSPRQLAIAFALGITRVF